MILRAKNWEEFQHYKDRDPPWIKLHKRLLDDRAFHRLPDASRALAPMLWLLASETKDGTIKDAVAEVSFRLRMTEKKADEALNPLIEAGFFMVEQDDSAAIAPCERDATQRERHIEQTEEEERAFAMFALAAKRNNRPEPAKLTDDRRKKLRARLDEHGIDGWQNMLDLSDASEFLNKTFPLKIDWVLEPKNFRKVIEGNYANNKAAPKVNGFSKPDTQALPPSEPWEQRVTGWVTKRQWLASLWGPAPGENGCRVPPKIIHQVTEAHRP